MQIPLIDTPRLVLRGHRPDDFEIYASMWANPALTRFIGDGSIKPRAEAWTSFLRQVGHWQMMGFGNWGVEEKASARQVGTIGFKRTSPRGTGRSARTWLDVRRLGIGKRLRDGKPYGSACLGCRAIRSGSRHRRHRTRQCRFAPCRREMRVPGISSRVLAGRPRVFLDRTL